MYSRTIPEEKSFLFAESSTVAMFGKSKMVQGYKSLADEL
jgi:hypothetical protein